MGEHMRAKAGGEFGINGEFYGGGEFMPSSQDTIKGENKRREKAVKSYMQKKQEVQPYKWELPPAENMQAIFGWTAFYCYYDRHDDKLHWGNFSQEHIENRGAETNGGYTRQQLMDMYNSGQRWFVNNNLWHLK